MASIPMVWAPSLDPTTTGYQIAYGTASGNYTFFLDAGNTIEATVIVDDFQTTSWFLAVRAYDALAQFSAFTNEVSFFVAEMPAVCALGLPDPAALY